MHERKHVLISQSLMWTAVILVVALVEEKQIAVFLLALLATGSFLGLMRQTSTTECE